MEPDARIAVTVDGILFSGDTWGAADARPLLLIHGVTSSAGTWWRVGPALAADGRRVVAVDLPGHGRTGHWTGLPAFADTAQSVAAFAGATGLDEPGLQVIGHSWGAMVAAALPSAGLRPSTIVLLDPPCLPHTLVASLVDLADEQTHATMDDAITAVRAANPDWAEGDVLAKAQALTLLDETAARSVLLDNGDWDGGLAALSDPAADGIDVWVVRGETATGGYMPETAIPAFAARIGEDHIITIAGGPHSPHRTHFDEVMAAFGYALEG
jgi:pimeloyl-ACP methyl ester carboxylesterase